MFIVVGIFLQIQIFLNHWISLHFERIFLNSICFYSLLLQLKWWRRGGLFRITASNASPDPMMWTMFSFDLAKGAEQTNLMEKICWNIKQQHNNSLSSSPLILDCIIPNEMTNSRSLSFSSMLVGSKKYSNYLSKNVKHVTDQQQSVLIFLMCNNVIGF